MNYNSWKQINNIIAIIAVTCVHKSNDLIYNIYSLIEVVCDILRYVDMCMDESTLCSKI